MSDPTRSVGDLSATHPPLRVCVLGAAASALRGDWNPNMTTNLSSLRTPLTIAAVAATSASLIAASARADDITPIVMWGASPEGALSAPDPAYTEVFNAFALGDAHGVVIVAPGTTARGWGRNDFGQGTVPALPLGTSYNAVAAGSNHTALLRSDGEITCVGDNSFGQCDVPVHALPFARVACGADFTLAVDINEVVFAWGDNSSGQTTVPGGLLRPIALSGGLDHAVHLDESGTLTFWGDNSEGEQTPPDLTGGLTINDVRAGWNTTAYLLSDGTVQVVGDNTFLQQVVPPLGAGESYSTLRAYGFTIGALRSDGEIVLWGNTSNDLDVPPTAPDSTIFKSFQIGFGFAGALYSLDCDGDGAADTVQITGGSADDCNGDNRIDSCELGNLVFESGVVAPFASADTVTLTMTDVSDAIGDVMVEIEVKTDLGSPGEFLTLSFNGQVIDFVFTTGGSNCPASFQKETIFLPASMFNAMLEDGDAVFELRASSLVSVVECPSSAAQLTVSYFDGSADCNSNGTPDSCELASGEIADLNGDGIPDTCQLEPVGDIDGDRKADVIWFNPNSRQFSAWFMDGLTRTAGGYIGDNAPDGFSIGGVGDLDGDGRSDVVLRNISTGAVRGMLLAGSATAEAGPISGVVPGDYRLLAVVDINGDGNDDILWKSGSDGKVYGWLMHGLVKLASGEIGDTAGLQFLGAGDLDLDGKADILWRNASNTVSGWLLDGLTISRDEPVADAGPVFSDWSPSGMGDLDGDGQADLLWRNTSSGQINAWFMDGLTKASGGTVSSSVSLIYTVAGLMDLDGDSRVDIVWRNTTNGDVNGWLMDGLTKRSGAFIRNATLDWRIINP
ncbi:MAG: hypothetical protein RLZZ238_913 [Planctomycetota bacterium]